MRRTALVIRVVFAVMACCPRAGAESVSYPTMAQTAPHATLEGTTITLQPSGATFALPARWIEKEEGNVFLSHEELKRVKIGVGEWTSQYMAVVNATLPFEKCFAQVEGSTLDLHMRTYIDTWKEKDVREIVRKKGIPAIAKSGKNTSQAAFKTTHYEKWQVNTLTFYLDYGDYGGVARMDFYTQTFGKQTVVLVFMLIDGDKNSEAARQKIVDSFAWKA